MFHLLLSVIYLAFISLGLPDGLLGSGWPAMYLELGVPVSYMGIVTMIISCGTIVSSLNSDRLMRKLGTGKVTLISVLMTAIALFGFSFSNSFLSLCLWAIPYGLGAGSVDAALNNYVALHYTSRHMSWLHCMWGVGASAGPYIMSLALSSGQVWNMGYRYVGLIQMALTVVLFLSLPLWKKPGELGGSEDDTQSGKALTLGEIFRIPGAKAVLVCFFCYCALEQTAGQWASSYLALGMGLDKETAASWGALFYLGITLGRGFNGFIANRFTDPQMIRAGQVLVASGVLVMLLPLGPYGALVGLLLVGLGCAPIYPCVIHSTPDHFGADKFQALVGVQMAFAYVGTCLIPPFFGVLADAVTIRILPCFLLLLLAVMIAMHELLCSQTAR